MDDDIRNRFRVPRRDYSVPPARPHRPANPNPYSHLPAAKPAQTRPHHAVQAHSQPMFPTAGQPYAPAPARPVTAPAPRHEPRPPEHAPARAHHSQTQTRQKSRRLPKILITLVIITALAAGGWLWAYPKYFPANPFPAQIQTSAKTALFYPNKLPAGYLVDHSTMNLSNTGVVTFKAVNADKHIVFTIQAAPPNFDFATFYKTQMTNAKVYTTPYGEATIGTNDKRPLGSLAQDNTWLILSTNSQAVTNNDMALIMANLKKF